MRGQIGVIGVDTGIDNVDMDAGTIVGVGVGTDARYAPGRHLRRTTTATTAGLAHGGVHFAIKLDIGNHRVGTQSIQRGFRYTRRKTSQHLAIGVTGSNAMLTCHFGSQGAVVGAAMVLYVTVEGDDDIEKTISGRCGNAAAGCSKAGQAQRYAGCKQTKFHCFYPQKLYVMCGLMQWP